MLGILKLTSRFIKKYTIIVLKRPSYLYFKIAYSKVVYIIVMPLIRLYFKFIYLPLLIVYCFTRYSIFYNKPLLTLDSRIKFEIELFKNHYKYKKTISYAEYLKLANKHKEEKEYDLAVENYLLSLKAVP